VGEGKKEREGGFAREKGLGRKKEKMTLTVWEVQQHTLGARCYWGEKKNNKERGGCPTIDKFTR